MKRILADKSGVTLLESVIALGLLALVAGGAFAVLLAASRQTTQPDIREEMTWAVENAQNQLKILTMYADRNNSGLADLSKASLPDTFYSNGQAGLCDKYSNPLSAGSHTINCLLPPICDAHQSSFTYTVANGDTLSSAGSNTAEEGGIPASYNITFSITCNGYSL